MVRNAGSMCCVLQKHSTQNSTVHYSTPTYVCYCTLSPSPTYIRHILFWRRGGRDIEKDSEQIRWTCSHFLHQGGPFLLLLLFTFTWTKAENFEGIPVQFCRSLLLPHLPSSAPHKALLKLADKQYQQSKANKSIAWY